ncbi:MAG TPA: DotU family type IV/VI secretion system protein [Longimicrobiaceae bacterium]
MTTATLEPSAPAAPAGAQRRGQLALLLQEAFTAAIRLRSQRQVVADAALFRGQVKQLLAATDHDARRLGYDAGHVRLAIYAYIAFLDESVLNSGQPAFASWPRQPLQEEVFGDHMAGETFFRNLEELLGRQDSEDVADVLEVYHLCLLLGFRGRYAGGERGGAEGLAAAAQDKVRRVRGGAGPLSPAWALPQGEVLPVAEDPWIRRLVLAAAGAGGTALVLYVLFLLLLRPGVGDLRALVERLIG